MTFWTAHMNRSLCTLLAPVALQDHFEPMVPGWPEHVERPARVTAVCVCVCGGGARSWCSGPLCALSGDHWLWPPRVLKQGGAVAAASVAFLCVPWRAISRGPQGALLLHTLVLCRACAPFLGSSSRFSCTCMHVAVRLAATAQHTYKGSSGSCDAAPVRSCSSSSQGSLVAHLCTLGRTCSFLAYHRNSAHQRAAACVPAHGGSPSCCRSSRCSGPPARCGMLAGKGWLTRALRQVLALKWRLSSALRLASAASHAGPAGMLMPLCPLPALSGCPTAHLQIMDQLKATGVLDRCKQVRVAAWAGASRWEWPPRQHTWH